MIEAIKRFIGMILGVILIIFFISTLGGVFEVRHPDHHDVDAINIHFVPTAIPGFVGELTDIVTDTYRGWRDEIINFSVGESWEEETRDAVDEVREDFNQ